MNVIMIEELDTGARTVAHVVTLTPEIIALGMTDPDAAMQAVMALFESEDSTS